MELMNVAKIVDAVLMLVVSLVTYSVIRTRERLDVMADRLSKVESEKISEDKAREIISTELKDIKDTLHKIADTVVDIRVEQAKTKKGE